MIRKFDRRRPTAASVAVGRRRSAVYYIYCGSKISLRRTAD